MMQPELEHQRTPRRAERRDRHCRGVNESFNLEADVLRDT